MHSRALDIIFTAVILNILRCASSEHILSCNVTALNPCPSEFQVCNATSHRCECIPGYVEVGDSCEKPGEDSEVSHAATVSVVLICLVLVICGLVLVVRRYNLVEYARQKINLRRNNDVMYEDVMIGQDDPPLSPG